MSLTIKTDHKTRPLLYWHELPAKAQKEFDYLVSDEDQQSSNFVKYKNWYYDISEFICCSDELLELGWSGYRSDSFFSGVLLKFDKSDNNYVIMATYFS
jgi:hypothetical protein